MTQFGQTLISAAMLGSDRQPFILPQGNLDSLDRLLAQIDTTDPAKALLRTAATIELAEKAGRVPPIPDFDPVSPCRPEELPICPPPAGDALGRMLAGEFPEVLPEWLERVAAKRWCVPPEHLPDLLSWGNRHPQLRSPILRVLGHRGRWLAQLNQDWQYARESLDRSVWETGTRALRVWALQRMRQHDPTQARDWVSSTWKQDKAPDRAAFLATFNSGLSLSDEELLELALDDKSKQVRAIAADLLARLPDSQLTQRASDRMTQVAQILTQPILSLDLELPSECSATALRDGIVSLSGSEIGEKAGWLLQMLGQVPPDFWTHRPRTLAVGDMLGGTGGSPAPENSPNAPVLDGFNIRPQELLQVAASSQWYGIWLEGMAIAAQRHQHLEWAEALLAVLPTFPGNGYNLSELSQNLMEILPIERRESLVWQILQTDRGDRLKKNHPLLFLLRLCRHCWSPDLSLAVLNRMAIDISTSQDNYNWGVRSTIRDFAYFIHPAILSDAQRLLKNAVKPESYWAQTVEEFLEILQFRHDMLLAIEYSQSANAS